jgi:outer membrane protein
MTMTKQSLLFFLLLTGTTVASAQNKKIGLDEAVRLGLQNSRTLKLSQNKIDIALSKAAEVKDMSIPAMKASAGYSHALMLSRSFALPSSGGQESKPITLPFDNAVIQATLSANEPLFDRHRYKYAKENAALLVRISQLDAEKDREEIRHQITSAYINYYKILQNQKILEQDLNDIGNKLEEVKKFEQQGLAIRNDVLNFELQQSNIRFLRIDAEGNRKAANYSLNVILGLPDNTVLSVEDLPLKLDTGMTFMEHLQQAMTNRKEFALLASQDRLADVNIKRIRAERLPEVDANGSFYFINPSGNPIPKKDNFLAPFLLGVTLSWDVGELLKNKNKLAEARIQKQGVALSQEDLSDKVRSEVFQHFQQYRTSLEKLTLLQATVEKAEENERVTEVRFHNNLATTTERIDAQTLLYQSRLNLELAKADAAMAYYDLIHATGQNNP